jgi:hypothetical protein
LELSLLNHRLGQIIHAAKPGRRGCFHIRRAASWSIFFGPQICKMIGQLGQIPAYMSGCDASAQ